MSHHRSVSHSVDSRVGSFVGLMLILLMGLLCITGCTGARTIPLVYGLPITAPPSAPLDPTLTTYVINADPATVAVRFDSALQSPLKLTPQQTVSGETVARLTEHLEAAGLQQHPQHQGAVRIHITVEDAEVWATRQTYTGFHRLRGGAVGSVTVRAIDTTPGATKNFAFSSVSLAPEYTFGGSTGIADNSYYPTSAAGRLYGSPDQVVAAWTDDRPRLARSLIERATHQAVDAVLSQLTAAWRGRTREVALPFIHVKGSDDPRWMAAREPLLQTVATLCGIPDGSRGTHADLASLDQRYRDLAEHPLAGEMANRESAAATWNRAVLAAIRGDYPQAETLAKSAQQQDPDQGSYRTIGTLITAFTAARAVPAACQPAP
jgi:hypothetical protein